MLELRAVSKRYGKGTLAMDDVDLEVKEGEFVSLLGPSGSGKTTTLRTVAGFEQPDSGLILVDGAEVESLPAFKRPINTVFQDYALFPHLDVRANVAFGLRAHRVARAERDSRVDEALEMVAVADFAGRSPGELSGGQRQRVALARALVMRPKILLLDEPLGALDLKLRNQMQLALVDLCHQLGISFLYVTHDQAEAFTMSDRVAVMSDGRIEQFSDPRSLYENPATAFVASFVGEMNFLEATLSRLEDDGAATAALVEGGEIGCTAAGGEAIAVGDPVQVAIRPEDILLTEAEGAGSLRGRVNRALFVSGAVRVHVALPDGQEVQATVPGAEGERFFVGAEVRISLAPARTRVFPA